MGLLRYGDTVLEMPFQDDAREDKIVDLFNLERPENRVRHGTDAILRVGDRVLEFELKSVAAGKGLTTVRDFGPDHIAKWKNKHWIIAVYNGSNLQYCIYGSPASMAPWIEERWRYIEADFNLSKCLPGLLDLRTMRSIVGSKPVYTKADAKKLHKQQYSAAKYKDLMDVSEMRRGRQARLGYSPSRMLEITKDRAQYLIERGSTLNNPHVPFSYFAEWEQITRNHASRLRQLVTEWISASSLEANVPLQEQPDTT